MDWKENAIPATTRRHKQLVINTGPSPRRSQGDAIPSPPPGTERLRMAAWKKLILLLDAEFGFFWFFGKPVKNMAMIFLGGDCNSDLWSNFRGEGIQLGIPGGRGWHAGWGDGISVYPIATGQVGWSRFPSKKKWLLNNQCLLSAQIFLHRLMIRD